MCSDLACRNGLLLKAGSSAMEILSATRLPEKTEKLNLPRVTLRPKAAESCVSSVGRKVLALMNNGTTRSATSKSTAMATRMLVSGCFFTRIPPIQRRILLLIGCGTLAMGGRFVVVEGGDL